MESIAGKAPVVWRSGMGVVMKCGAEKPIRLGLVLLVLGSPLLGQNPPSSGTDRNQPVSEAQSSTTQSDANPGSRPHNGNFIIGNDDVLAISVWKEPDLSKSVPVRSDGKISLPLVGEIQATGRTPFQLEQDISAKL